jgi:hypothetical protein
MPFVKIIKSAIGARHNTIEEIRMGSRFQSAKQSSRSIYISLTRSVIERLGWKLTATEDSKDGRVYVTMAVNEGTVEDAGFWLLVEDEKGYVAGSGKGNTSGQSFGCGLSLTRLQHYVLNDTAQEMAPEPVEFTIDEKEHTVLVQCPDWLRYNPLSVPEPEKKPVPPPPPVQLHPGRRHRR